MSQAHRPVVSLLATLGLLLTLTSSALASGGSSGGGGTGGSGGGSQSTLCGSITLDNRQLITSY